MKNFYIFKFIFWKFSICCFNKHVFIFNMIARSFTQLCFGEQQIYYQLTSFSLLSLFNKFLVDFGKNKQIWWEKIESFVNSAS